MDLSVFSAAVMVYDRRSFIMAVFEYTYNSTGSNYFVYIRSVYFQEKEIVRDIMEDCCIPSLCSGRYRNCVFRVPSETSRMPFMSQSLSGGQAGLTPYERGRIL